ncbi:MAG: hypothetical protein DRP08_07890, partial [Candidatus Aenigmatarchaeota archaeon]
WKEEYIFKTRKVVEKVKPDIERILEFKTTPKKDEERLPFEELFRTPCGVRFGNQAEAATDFALRGYALSVILPVAGKVSSIVGRGIARGDLDVFKTDETSPIDHAKIELLETLAKDFTVPSPDEVEELVHFEDDVLWFLSLVTFSFHPYLDVYSMCIIDFVGNQEVLDNAMQNHLLRCIQPITDPLGNPILKTAQLKRLGVFNRLAAIEQGLGLSSIIENLLEAKELDGIRKACKKFNHIRGRIAHSDPRLPREKYTFAEFEKDLEEPLLDFESMKKEAKLPKYLNEVMKTIEPEIESLSEIYGTTALVVRMAITYPAILDVILSALLSYSP